MKKRSADAVRSSEDKDWLWSMLVGSVGLHLIVWLSLLFANGSISTPDTFVIRSMTFMHEDTVTPIRVASAPRAPVPVGETKAEVTSASPEAEEAEIVRVPAESYKPVLKEEDKLQLAEVLAKRPGGKDSRSPLFLQVVRERISESCEKHVSDRISSMGFERVVVLSVSLLPSGELESVEVVKSSDMPVVDKASMEAVRLAAPFPAFPADLRRDLETLNITKLKLTVPIRFALNRKEG